MKQFNNYSELANIIVDTFAKKSGVLAKSIDGKSVKSLDKAFGVDISSKLHGNKGKMIRGMLKIFGILLNSGNISVVKLSPLELKNIAIQTKPIVKYFSRTFIENFLSSITKESDFDYKQQDSITRIVKRLTEQNKFTDYLLSLITDRQYELVNRTVKSNTKNNEHLPSSTNKEAALKEEVQRLKKQLEKRNISYGSDELFIERIEDSINAVAPSLGFINEKWKGDKTFNHNESATEVLHISDWHIGEVDNIGGFNKFNYTIACDRVKILTNKVISWTKMHRSMYKVDELVIIATGDMISGDIHDELRATNEFPAPEQCVKAAMLISKMVNELSSVFKKVRVEYIVADNHSRTTKKIEFAPGTNSYNYIVGTMSKILLRDNSTVEFNVYPEIQHVVKVEGLKYLITHGNSIRGGFAGIPYYGMTRKLGAEALIRMNMPEDSHFNRIVMGHYHSPLLNNSIEMTGCLSSTTAFDHASGRHSPACQTAWLVSKKFEMDYSTFWLS